MNVNSQRAQVTQLPPHLPFAVAFPRAGDGPVEPGEAREITTERRPISGVSPSHRPASQSLVDAIDALDLAGPPTKNIPKEGIGGFGRVLGAEQFL